MNIELGPGRLYVAPVGVPAPPVTGEWWEDRPRPQCTCGEPKGAHYPDCPLAMRWTELAPPRVYVAPAGTAPADRFAWRELGTVDPAALAGLTVSLLTEADDDGGMTMSRYAPTARIDRLTAAQLTGGTTVSFTLIPASRDHFRLLFGDLRGQLLHRIHTDYRRRARARVRRGRG